MQAPAVMVTLFAIAFLVLGLCAAVWPRFFTGLNSQLFHSVGLENRARQAKSRSQIIQARIAGVIMFLIGGYLTGVALGIFQ